MDKINPRSTDDDEAGVGMRWTNSEDRCETQVRYGVDHETEIVGKAEVNPETR
jgi:hypothetical protein